MKRKQATEVLIERPCKLTDADSVILSGTDGESSDDEPRERAPIETESEQGSDTEVEPAEAEGKALEFQISWPQTFSILPLDRRGLACDPN